MFEDLIKKLEELGRWSVEVGVFGEDRTKDPKGSFYVMIANVHEYGIKIRVTKKMRAFLHSQGLHLKKSTQYITIPERSFMRVGIRVFEEGAFQLTGETALFDFIEGRITAVGVYEKIGLGLESAIKDALLSRTEPPLHPFTISRRRKKSAQPLVDTGGLLQRIQTITVPRSTGTGGEG